MNILGVYVPPYVLIIGLFLLLMAVIAVWQETQKWK